MNFRTFIVVGVLLLVAIRRTGQAQQAVDPYAVPNAFAAAYNEWGALYKQRLDTVGMNGVDLKEQRAFKRMADQFGEFKKFVKSQY